MTRLPARIFCLIFLCMFQSVHAQEPLTDDFDAPQGADLQSPAESPGRFRMLSATSEDGLTFTPSGRVILDQANVPDMVLAEDERLFLYFTGWGLGDRQNVIAVAISDDWGETWVFKYVEVESLTVPFGDPDVVLLPDGTFRLYATTEIERGKIGIVYAEGADGVHFTKVNVALALPDGSTIDSTTFLWGETWHMFTLPMQSPDPLYSTSSDGLTFTFQGQMSFDGYVVSNGIALEEGFRLYGFSLPNRDIRSFFATDGQTWTKEDGVRLAFDPNSPLEGDYIKDPAIQQLPDGTYLMIYVTRIPD